MKDKINTTYLKAMAMRVLRSTCSTLLGIIGTVKIIDEVKWNAILPTVFIAAISSLLMCIISLPETSSERILDNDIENQNILNNSEQKGE